jgi:hypothetical protein
MRIPQVASASGKPGPVESANLQQEPFAEGAVLLQSWLDRLTVSPNYTELAMLLRAYHDWLKGQFVSDASPRLLIDALPQNIIVDADNNWRLIDKEWLATDEITSGLVFFRAAYHFGLIARSRIVALNLLSSQSELDNHTPSALVENLDHFIRWCFQAVDEELTDEQLNAFVQWESAMQDYVVREPYRRLETEVLSEPLAENTDQVKLVDLHPLEVRVFWTQVDGVWHIDHSAGAKYHGKGGLSAEVKLPAMIATHPFIQISPARCRINNCNGWLDFKSLSIEEIGSDGKRKIVFEINQTADLLKAAKLENISVSDAGLLLFTGLEPKITLNAKTASWSTNCDGAVLNFQVNAPLVQDYSEVHQALVNEDDGLAERIRNRQTLLNIQNQRIAQASEILAQLERKLGDKKSELVSSFGKS